MLLAALSSIGPFAIDTYLPSFHAIGTALSATPLEVQQTLSAYLLPFALMTLWHGAIADAYGRRRVILVALTLFALASVGCALAARIELLWLMRALQGVSAGAGIVVSRAIVRDLYDGAEAQRLMSQVAMMFALAPAVAPLIGGWLAASLGWRAVFALLALLTLALALACWRLLPETLAPAHRQSLHPGYLWRAYRQLLGAPPFLAASAALSLNFSGFFLYVLSAPVFLMDHLGLPQTAFLWLFGPGMLGLMLGSWLSGRLAGRLSRRRTVGIGYLIMALAAVTNLGLCLLLPPAVPWSVAPLFVYTLGMALAMPILTLHALDPYPEKRGLAASCQTFLQAAFSAVVAGVIAPLLWGSTVTLALGMAGFLVLGAIAWQVAVAVGTGSAPTRPLPPGGI